MIFEQDEKFDGYSLYARWIRGLHWLGVLVSFGVSDVVRHAWLSDDALATQRCERAGVTVKVLRWTCGWYVERNAAQYEFLELHKAETRLVDETRPVDEPEKEQP